MQNKTEALNLRIDETVYERLDEFCKACGMAKRKVVEKAIADFIEKNQRFAKEMNNRKWIRRELLFQRRFENILKANISIAVAVKKHLNF